MTITTHAPAHFVCPTPSACSRLHGRVRPTGVVATLTSGETAVRERLASRGYRLWKVHERSPMFSKYGPYAIANARTNTLDSWALSTLDDVNGWLAKHTPAA